MNKNKRFIEKRVKINKIDLNKIIWQIKKDNNFTWHDISNILKISDHSIRYGWLKKGNSIPLSIFKRLITLSKNIEYNNIEILEPYWGQKIGKKSKFNEIIKIPKINSKEFAEFYGILLGDGCVYNNLSGFCISSNSIVDKYYIEDYVSNLIFKLFGVKPKLYKSNQSKVIRCVVYSKKISSFLINLGFPKGKKSIGNNIILKEFFNDPILLKACIRGLNDTDGSIFPHPNSKVAINISINSKKLLDSSINAFKTINIKVGSSKKSINIYGQLGVNNYFRLIGSSNIKHIYKYKTFLIKGYIPNKNESEAFLRDNSPKILDLPYFGPVV